MKILWIHLSEKKNVLKNFKNARFVLAEVYEGLMHNKQSYKSL